MQGRIARRQWPHSCCLGCAAPQLTAVTVTSLPRLWLPLALPLLLLLLLLPSRLPLLLQSAALLLAGMEAEAAAALVPGAWAALAALVAAAAAQARLALAQLAVSLVPLAP